jgi:pimeloyl-ACP methyl ester carboxylesterase
MTSLVLVHGITESKHSWDPLLDPLSAGESGTPRKILAVDLRGHGAATRAAPFDLATMATDVLQQMSSADIAPEDTLLIGHSLGGTVVTAMASVATFRGVINIDQPLKLADFQAGLQQLEPMLRGEEAGFVAAIGMVFDAMRGQLPDAEYQRLAAIRRPEQPVVLGVWDPVLTLPAAQLDAIVEAMTRSITSPYLSLHGIDPGPDYAEWLDTHVPGATAEVWPDHGHYPHLVDPARFVARVEDFLGAIGT